MNIKIWHTGQVAEQAFVQVKIQLSSVDMKSGWIRRQSQGIVICLWEVIFTHNNRIEPSSKHQPKPRKAAFNHVRSSDSIAR